MPTEKNVGAYVQSLARESGFADAADLLRTAQSRSCQNVYLIRFPYLPPGARDPPPLAGVPRKDRSTLLQRIRRPSGPKTKKR
jgi:hypothetical protein